MLPNTNPARGLSAIRSILRQAKLDLNFARNEVLDPRITFSRTSNATRTNAQGLIEYAPHNLLTYSENFDNAVWVKGTGVTVTPNTTASPDGTTTADLIASPQDQGCYENLLSVGAGITVTNSIYIKAGTATQLLFRDDLGAGRHIVINPSTGQIVGSSGTIMSSGSTNIGNGWYRYYMTYVTDSVNARNWVRNDTAGTLTYYTWGAQLNIGSLQPYYTTSVKNLLGYSQNFENAAWTKSNSTIDATPVMGPLGFLGAEKLVENTANSSHYTIQTATILNGTPFTASIFIKAGERTFARVRLGDAGFIYEAVINLATGIITSTNGVGSNSVVNLGNGWFRISCTGTVVSGNIASIGIYLRQNATTEVYTGDGTSGIYIFGAQLSDSASLDPYVYNFGAAPTSTAYYGPRFDYDPVTLAPKGLLIEESRNNLNTYSQAISVANGYATDGKANLIINAATAPDGTLTASNFESTTNGATQSYYYKAVNGLTIGATYTYSVFVKLRTGGNGSVKIGLAGTGAAVTFNLLTGVISTIVGTSTGFIDKYGSSGWYRCSMTAVATATGHNITIDNLGTSNIGEGNTVWGAQLEQGAFPTSYIPTTSAQVTRAADNASMVGTNFSSWYNQSEGTIYSEWMLGGDNTSVNVYNINDATGNNYIRNRYNSAGSVNDNAIGVGGIVQSVLNATNQITTYSDYKNAMAYKQNDFARSASGNLVTSFTGNIPVVNQINLGASVVPGAESLNGHIQSFKFFSKRFIDTYLQRLTQ